MNQRFKTGLLMGLALIPLLIWGDRFFIFTIFCLLLSIGAAIEFRLMVRKIHELPKWIDLITVALTGLIYLSVYAVAVNQFDARILLIEMILILMIFAILMVFVEEFNPGDFGNAILTILYCSLGFATFSIFRTMGLHYVLYILIVVMVTDTAAYFFGIRFGKHKIAPTVSPKKSVEGSIAGLIFGVMSGTLFGYFLSVMGSGYSILHYILISVAVSTVGQIGDLVASKFKRSHGIKDYSNLFPGHGGILDRFDSSVFSSLFLFLILLISEVF
jgi:phosphatidate cytidylyltransferase